MMVNEDAHAAPHYIPSTCFYIIMELVTTKRGARALSMKVISMFRIGEDEMDISSEGVGEVAAAVGLSALFKMR